MSAATSTTTAMSPGVTVLVALSSLIPNARGQGWTEIMNCASSNGRTTRPWSWTPEGGLEEVQYLARSSSAVRLCTSNNPLSDACITSRPESFPIINLRLGAVPLSHIGPGGRAENACGTECAHRFWTAGPGMAAAVPGFSIGRNLAPRCGASPTTDFFHACGNSAGIHIQSPTSGQGGQRCTWDFTWRDTSQEIWAFIDSSGTREPSVSPSSSPSPWFMHRGNQANMTQLQTQVARMEITINALTRQLASFANQTYVDTSFAAANQRMELLQETITSDRLDLAANMSRVENAVTALRSTLRAAVASTTTTTGGNSQRAPTIEATATDVTVMAPNAMRLQTGGCTVDDLCEVSAFADRLRDALA